MADEKIIEAVRNFPCLWQVSSRSYKDSRARENAWKEVATQAGVPVTDCNRRWKSLRDKFVHELKKTKTKKTGSAGPEYVSCWPLFQTLLFLQDSVRHKPTKSNFYEEPVELISSTNESQLESNDVSELDEIVQPPTDSPPTRASTYSATDFNAATPKSIDSEPPKKKGNLLLVLMSLK